ncbi:hypothetical protein Cgig2_024000 [Carnegiea gigantea]|uniref:Cation/H+ exchanger domain-containing protein n=1 Tax=Carnegiea gigantea TaxID=171969 RepID=A0A9Q1QH51_9CARY|nr:hypothetical protein Cgig2_024000 [Carnegiea gigantea]
MNSQTNATSQQNSSYSDCLKVRGWHLQGQYYLLAPFHMLQLQLIIVFFLTQSLHHLCFKHFGLPPLVSQSMAGLLLSRDLLISRVKGLKTVHERIFPQISNELWQTMATVGLSLFLFLIGVKMDFTLIRRNGKTPFAIGLLMLVIPGIVNKLVANAYDAQMARLNQAKKLELTSSASVLVLTAFPVIAILLSDLNLLHSELGRLALSTGIVSELGSIFLMVSSKAITAIRQEHNPIHTNELLQQGMRIVSLVMSAVFLIRPLMNLIVKWTPKGRPVASIYLALVIMFMLIGALITDMSGEHVMFGCFVVGAAMPEGPPLGSTIVQKFESFVFGMLMPFFITTSVMVADFRKVDSRDKLLHGQVLVTFTAFVTKIIICIACGWFYNLSMFDALALGAIIYAYLIIVTTITATIMPIAIKLLYHPRRKYGGYKKRDIMHSKADAPLRILACVHRPDNVSSLIKLLSFCGITKQNRIALNVVHLMKLVGRAQPLFISHDLQQRKASSVTYSEDVIWTLNSFHKDNMDGLSMHVFTTITPPKAMHEDICTLALNELASIIILPFHRKLSIDFSIDSEDHVQRALNCSILERAPCSVGILVDRGSYKPHATLASNSASNKHDKVNENDKIMVGVIFIGGNDDREAVAYAKRIAQGKKARKVVVFRIMASGENPCLKLLDSSVLSGIQDCSSSNSCFQYVQKVAAEGSETAKILRAIIGEDFDLIIVGRRYEMDCPQTSGLNEWCEVPELGILGDLLASPDLRCRTSVLVIQQQKQWTWKDY